jgi:ribonuclease P protein component
MLRRITAHAEYRSFLTGNKSCRLPHFFIPVLPGDEAEFAFGITTVKRMGKAVVRNKLKRRIKAYMTTHAADFPLGLKVNLIARNGSTSLTWQELNQELTQLSSLLQTIIPE